MVASGIFESSEPPNGLAVLIRRPRRLGTYFLAAGVSALLLGLCFPEPGWSPLAYVALVPVALLVMRAKGIWRLAWTTYVVALLWWLVMLRWLTPVTVMGYVTLAAYLSLYMPATLILFGILDRRWRIPATAALPMAWVTLEFIRGLAPAEGFAWFCLGHSQAPFDPAHGVSLMIQVADLGGDHAVSFLVAASNGVIADVLTMPWARPSGAGHRVNRRLLLTTTLWAAGMAAAMIYGAYRIKQTGGGPCLEVAVIQTNVPQSNKTSSSIEQLEQDWQQLVALTQRAMRHQPKPDLIVRPETMVPGPLNLDTVGLLVSSEDELDRWLGKFHAEIAALAKHDQVDLLVGAQTRIRQPHRTYNSVYRYDRRGMQGPRRYDKIHRVPFGEYIPWVESSPWLMRLFIKYLTPYDHDYTLTPGTQMTVFEVGPSQAVEGEGEAPGVRVATPICFEDAVSRLCRRLVYEDASKRADLLVNLTNDAWFVGWQRRQHLQIAVFRSVENRVPTARSVNTGVSGFISSIGRVGPILSKPAEVEGRGSVLAHSVCLDGRSTIFGCIGHKPIAAIAIISGGLTVLGLFRRKTENRDNGSRYRS